MTHQIKRGDRVTVEVQTYFDGRPVRGWPSPLYMGTVRSIEHIYGNDYARVKWDAGRIELCNVDRITGVNPTAAGCTRPAP